MRQPGREHSSLLEIVRLEVCGGDLHAQIPLAVLTLAEIADQRQKRPNLPAGEREMDAIDILAAPLDPELPNPPQVETPVPTTNHKRRKARLAQDPTCRFGLQ